MNKPGFFSLHRLTSPCLAVLAACLLLAPTAANATPYVVKLMQQGNDVVAIGTGAIDLSGLTPSSNTTLQSGSVNVFPNLAGVGIGATGVNVTAYSGLTGPTNIGSGSGVAITTGGSGEYAEIFGSTSGYCCGLTGPLLFVQSDYVPGDAISNSATFSSQTFASIGLTPGTYVWTWGTGAEQSFTLRIGNAVGVPEPTALGTFGLGLLLIGAFVGLRRRMA